MANKGDISEITLPNNNTYAVKDALARQWVVADPNSDMVIEEDTSGVYDYIITINE